jgi:Cys-rich repeat protein
VRLESWLVAGALRLQGLWAIAGVAAVAGLAALAGLSLLGAVLRRLLGARAISLGPRSPAWVVVGVLATAGLSGCGSEPPVPPPCRSDADCPAGLACRKEASVCVGFTTPIVPAADGGDGGRAIGDAAADDGSASGPDR